VLFSETKQKFVNIQNNYITINPIVDSIDFFETNKLLKKLDDHKNILKEVLDNADFDKLWSKIDTMFRALS